MAAATSAATATGCAWNTGTSHRRSAATQVPRAQAVPDRAATTILFPLMVAPRSRSGVSVAIATPSRAETSAAAATAPPATQRSPACARLVRRPLDAAATGILARIALNPTALACSTAAARSAAMPLPTPAPAGRVRPAPRAPPTCASTRIPTTSTAAAAIFTASEARTATMAIVSSSTSRLTPRLAGY